jgi:hypothetical protein
MADIVVPDVDRLPWLTDGKAPGRKTSRFWLVLMTLLGAAAIAAVSFWYGRTLTVPANDDVGSAVRQTVSLPAPVTPAPIERATHVAEPDPMPNVARGPAPGPVVLRMQRDIRPVVQTEPRPIGTVARPTISPTVSVTVKPVPEKKALSFTNPWDSSVASGKMVRVGTYSNLRQGKIAWSKLAKAFPAMKKLPAVVTDIPSQRNGRVYYRLQIGTTSQAHSEVLCQRMRAIGQSCVVVGLAEARKGSGDERQPAGV